ncbi:MAG: methyltransferase domain-containing protein [Planctomycetes bacterium]|nr:methyltransferase domain-containing protein [Planctomycetota bacterium]
MSDDLIEYYARRALEYEKIYQKPERQQDIPVIIDYLRNELSELNVLEIACGTGYWTQYIAQSARSILATDINKEVLELAERKDYPKNNVRVEIADIYKLDNVKDEFDAGCGCFIWSHVPIQRLAEFLRVSNQKIRPNGKVVFVDNLYAPGSSTPIAKQDNEGNTYQVGKLADGTEHMVLKNFPDEEFIHNRLAGIATGVKFRKLQYYWLLSYQLI